MEHPFESRFVDAAGIRTHYLEAGSGPPLILLHGGGSGADAFGNWKECIPQFAENFRTLAVDMVGFGQTDKPDPAGYAYTQEGRNRHIADVIDALGLARPAIIGNSMGGATALGVAMSRPELLSRLVLMGSAGITVPDQPPSQALRAITGYDFTVAGMERLVDALTGPNYRADAETIRYRHQLSIEPDTRAALEAINAEVKRGGLVYDDDAVRDVKVATLVVNGQRDQISTIARAIRFTQLLDNSWAYLVPHCGHWVMIESPDDFVAATTAFVTSKGLRTS